MRRTLTITALAALLALPSFALGGPVAQTEITINDNFFNPKKPAARDFASGPSFHWSRASILVTNRHNVRQDDKLFRSGNPTTGPIDYTISASAGSYHYYCEIHRALGMTGVVRVRPGVLFDSQIGQIAVQWADSGTETGSRFDVRYKVDDRRWRIWKNDTRKFGGVFGRNDDPVNYNTDQHVYKLAVRSEKRDVSKRSNWSPPASLNA